MKKFIWHTPDLQLFAGEGDSAIGETGGIVADAGQEGALETDSDSEFNELINGKFKEQFSKRTQAIIDKRFKQTKELEAFRDKAQPLLGALCEKYGVSEGDVDSLAQAVQEEKSKSGDQTPVKNNLHGKINGWIKESEELKKAVPDFDLRAELRGDKTFGRLLLSGIPLKTAYETVHRDEILGGAVAFAADKVRRQVVHGIEARGMRPVENGVSSESAIVTSVDVNSLTSQDILKILKQVENGANIAF